MEPGEDAHSDEARLRGLYRGCLLGGAAGDALGAPVEFDSLQSIRSRFGEGGIRDFALAYGHRGAITDDTQMTLFTAEGLLRARMRGGESGSCSYPAMLAQAYQRWYHTQSPDIEGKVPEPLDGWLVGHQALHAPAAGLTCMRAVLRMALDGPRARNDSKGCGGVMRVAPIGLYVASFLESNDTGAAASPLTPYSARPRLHCMGQPGGFAPLALRCQGRQLHKLFMLRSRSGTYHQIRITLLLLLNIDGQWALSSDASLVGTPNAAVSPYFRTRKQGTDSLMAKTTFDTKPVLSQPRETD